MRSSLVDRLSEGILTQPKPDRSCLQRITNPELPPLLSPLPSLFRFIAFLIIAPIVFICLVDFVGYAIFRTLGFNRQRVRVKTKSRPQKITISDKGKSSSTAPLLSPGSYDADTLLRHRERSASAASAEALEEWARTGGQFARVSHVRAAKKSASTNSTISTSTNSASVAPPSGSTLPVPDLLSPPDSPNTTYGRVAGVGVEGALGYFDTDAEDSGAESGHNSPEIARRNLGRGLSGSALNFTPVSSEVANTKKSLGLHVPNTTTATPYSTETGERSPKSNESATSSWIQWEESIDESAIAEAAAADLEPSSAVSM